MQLGQTLLKGSTNTQRLQWQISKSIISVLSTIEKKWDPYQLDYPIDSNLKNYVNVWFHLVTVAFLQGVDDGRRLNRCRPSRGRKLRRIR